MMDSKEVKLALKNAREAIRKKDFKEALRHCKLVLADNNTNYNALVFVGVAAEGLELVDQALKAYKKAINESPDQILAWQGLCGFYEKNPNQENNADLVNIYEQLVNKFFINEKEKRLETMKKLCRLLSSLNNTDKAVEWYEKLLSEEDDDNGNKMDALLQLTSLLQALKSLTSEQEVLLLKTYKEALCLPDFPEDELKIQNYLALLSKNSDRSELLEECSILHNRFPSLSTPIESLLLFLLDQNIDCEMTDDQISELYEKLKATGSDEATTVVHLAMGYVALGGNKLIQARDHLQQGVHSDSSVVCGYYYLAKALLGLHEDSDCIQTCQKGLKMLEKKQRRLSVSSHIVLTSLNLIQARCLLRIGTPESLDHAEDILKKIKDVKQGEVQFWLTLVYIAKQEMEKAENCLKSTSMDEGKKLIVHGWIRFKLNEFQTALKSLEEAVQLEPRNSEAYYMLGRVLWELRTSQDVEKARERCFTAFLKAAQQDPYNSLTFMYLGHFNAEIQNDKLKAKKCYQKAFDLDSTNEGAGAALCDMMVAIGDEAAARDLLVSITKSVSAGCGKWAWLRLGLYQVKHEDPSLAVMSFQSALRADPADHHVWECLGEAYLKRGSYTAALKAFSKAAELDSESMYSLYQIANIKQTIGELPDAVTEYKQILSQSPNYVPALKGLGETYMLLAKQHLSLYLNDLARDDCQVAVLHLTRAAEQRPDFCCLWKLLGDVCTILHPLASQTFRIEVPVKLTAKTSKDSKEMTVLGKLELLQLGARCYARALKGMPECDSLWHDLGVNYYHQSETTDDDEVAKSLAKKAFEAVKKSLSLDATSFHHWNVLGVIACSKHYYKPELAQHCFIKSIQAQSVNTAAWTNLGALYLKEDNIQLAHEAFKIAQSLDPSYVACWIGQALVAESVGHVEAMDLFRHTTNLGNHLEGAIGYGHWVCSTLKDVELQNTDMFQYCIEHMAAIPTASDALVRYTGRVKTNPTAYNMLGMLLEHQGLFTLSAEAFKSACDLLGQHENDAGNLAKAKLNLARVLCEGGEYDKSITLYQSLPVLDTCEDICYLALALYKNGQMQESFKVYEEALGKTEEDEDKSHIYAALGMVLYKFDDLPAAKTAFFNSSQLSPPSDVGLLALCSLGLMQSDWTLATAVLQELSSLKHRGDHVHDVAWLTAISHMLQGNISSARSHLQKTVHKFSTSAGVWKVLSEFLLRYCPDSGKTSVTCARVSQHMNRSLYKSIPTLLTLGQLQGGCHHQREANNNALRSAQRALHMYPDSIPNLCSMVAAIHAEAVIEMSFGKGTQLFQIQDRYIDQVLHAGCSCQVQVWCLKVKIISLILRKDVTATKLAIQQLEAGSDSVSSTGGFVAVMSEVIADNISSVRSLVEEQKTDFYLWQVLVQMCIGRNQIIEADSVTRLCLQSATSHSKKQVQVMSLLKLASLPFQQIMTEQGEFDHMKSLFDEAATEVLKINPLSSATLLMLGVLTLKNNVRLSKRYFLQCYDAAEGQDGLQLGRQIARSELVKILHTSKKDSDILQKLLSDASECKDQKTEQLYKQLQATSVKSDNTEQYFD